MAETDNRVTQRQDSVLAQLEDLYRIAIERGMYDAADWIAKRTGR